ncbi:MAG: carbohydrate ABC transporter permease [Jiangellaceae bacterium]
MRLSVLPGRRRGETAAAGPAAATVVGPPAQRSLRRIFDDRLLPVLLVAPAILLIAGLIGYPVLRAMWLSLHEAGLAALTTGTMNFVGLDNYVEIMRDPDLRRSTVTTVLFGLACVVATMAVGIAVALLLNRPFRGRGLLAILVLLPWAVPNVATATVWDWLFHDQYGIANWALTSVGLSGFDGFAWFNQRSTAFIVIGLVIVWGAFPFVSIVLLAGLQTIPAEIVDAARVDGASPWQRTRLITLPMLKSLLLVLVVISTIWDFKVFDQVYVMTNGGGPARSTEVLSISTYREAFGQSNFGLGSALGVSLFVILLVVTVVYVRLVKDEEQVS